MSSSFAYTDQTDQGSSTEKLSALSSGLNETTESTEEEAELTRRRRAKEEIDDSIEIEMEYVRAK